jgi:GTPase
MPQLSDDTLVSVPRYADRGLAPGLEESRGALYEIGVSDDGTLVGLTKDEMDESIKTLRIMAASLGCSVEVLRMVIVGDCEWVELVEPNNDSEATHVQVNREEKLWVAEAHVTPNLGADDPSILRDQVGGESPPSQSNDQQDVNITSRGRSCTPQLRITFTGPTTSGKSSLLGTLSTGTLDNGRGKSRLSLLKHRHEVASGVTSSIAQEMIGYKDGAILNYSHGNIESWIDIHDCSEHGRLVLVTDSGGHPRYRRTVLRGLMNWAPHWSVLCIAADNGDTSSRNVGATSSAQDALGAAAAGVDLVQAHLTLSLRLEVPMAVVITKLDLASKSRLQKTMSKVLSAVKEAGRVPKIIQPDQRQHDGLLQIPAADLEKVASVINDLDNSENATNIVPIVLTSTVRGTGIGSLHALLEALPLPPLPTSRDFVGMALNPEQPRCLFHIDDTFSLPKSFPALSRKASANADQGVIVSGYLRFGSISVGDTVVVGPFPPADEEARGLTPDDKSSPGNHGLSISHPSSAELAKVAMKNAVSASTIAGEWHNARIVSLRNLRLPVSTLEAGQAGSVGIIFDAPRLSTHDPRPSSDLATRHIRRGMVLAIPSKHMLDTGLSLQAASGFTATFKNIGKDDLVVGSFVNVYVASMRAAARVRGISHRHYERYKEESNYTATQDIDDVFSLNEEIESDVDEKIEGVESGTDVFLELLHNREWVELGSRILLLEGGRQDRSGIEGFSGTIIEIID